MGDAFVAGPWTLGNKYKVLAPIAMIEVIVACVDFCLPFGPPGIPGNVDFAWDNGYVQYAPVVVGTVILLVGIVQDYAIGAVKQVVCPYSALTLERR